MTPSQMLKELLAAHSSLRGMVRETRSLADLACEGAPVTYQLRGALAVLADALKAHSLREEDLLTDVLRFVDPWGGARAEIMNDGHIEQHRALYDAIACIPKTPTEFAGAGVAELLEQLLDHMRREEEAFLNPEVLCDERVVTDSVSG
jgi:hypothetical protein